jgi:hypothetical protein
MRPVATFNQNKKNALLKDLVSLKEKKDATKEVWRKRKLLYIRIKEFRND